MLQCRGCREKDADAKISGDTVGTPPRTVRGVAHRRRHMRPPLRDHAAQRRSLTSSSFKRFLRSVSPNGTRNNKYDRGGAPPATSPKTSGELRRNAFAPQNIYTLFTSLSYSIRSCTTGSVAQALLDRDPRRALAEFFRPGDGRGPLGYLQDIGDVPSGGSASSYFAVWRPTSFDAIRQMMELKATGKGLNVKGKSAIRGKLAGFVPYVQIYSDEDKAKVGVCPEWATVRIYFQGDEAREQARATLEQILREMVVGYAQSAAALSQEGTGGAPLDAEMKAEHLRRKQLWRMPSKAALVDLDDAGCGLEMPERLMWEAYVAQQDLTPEAGWETGRPSEPAYFYLNLHATRDRNSQPSVVVWQCDATRPLNPCGLVVAYEEDGHVKPVVSDFDALLVGSRGETYAEPSAKRPALPATPALPKACRQGLAPHEHSRRQLTGPVLVQCPTDTWAVTASRFSHSLCRVSCVARTHLATRHRHGVQWPVTDGASGTHCIAGVLASHCPLYYDPPPKLRNYAPSPPSNGRKVAHSTAVTHQPGT